MMVKESSLLILRDIFHAFPTRTPNRLEHILECVKSICWNESGKDVIIDLNDDFSRTSFSPTSLEHVICLDNYFGPPENHPRDNYNTPIILVPKTLFCCEKSITIDSRAAEVTIYTDTGVKKANSFHGCCKKCGKTFYSGFMHDKKLNRRSFIQDSEYFIYGSGVGFSRDFIRKTTYQVLIGAISFESSAEIYNSFHGILGTKEAMNPDRLETGFLLYQITQYTQDLTWHRNVKNKGVDVEQIAEEQYPVIRDMIDRKWLTHSCEDVGCKNRFIVLDGNEKLFRLKCDEKGCINNPLRGNQFVSASKKCAAHDNGQRCKAKKAKFDNERLELRPVTRSMTSGEDVLTSGEGCKDPNSIMKFHHRSAGMIYIFRPCGIRLTHCEMLSHESLTQIFMSLVHCFGEEPARELLRGIVYDRSCDLKPFLDRLGRTGDTVAEFYANLEFIVDIFHVEKHTLSKCIINDPECTFHPHLPKFQYVRGMNTEVAEQSFHQLNKHKFSTRKMCYAKRLLYLKFVDDVANENWVLKHA